MKKLIAMYKSLPREVRLMLAMAGLGTPLGAIYILKRFLFPGMSTFMVILIVGGVVLGISLIGYLISRGFSRGARKRQRKMAGDLAREDTAGPVAMDVRASIKANNEKFFNAIHDMRKNAGLSVYDLPWYIVIGDSGCGKTKLINEGGLTFSTGKPEGYQLGTLNYNWWFTEDAIFVDMAGRLCNPQDDADRREWEAFLATVGRGRRGFPINGAVVCVSADHLLQDSPEKIEHDANTSLERLRDLQTRLGVTFATYVVVTKCDKILGFMQFFDRAERDITFKNQIFGWSKPGEFNELYDPEQFAADFEDVYGRLNELRLRRLQDEADEIDLGLAYSFPEEFRELLAPLQTYVRTLFPMIKKPRAIKNLIFRGIYFTSATQEGALILKHLTERLGGEVASQFAPLDLYPNKRPHFIKDLLMRKVFPEYGLVFRNEEQALRNRKMTRLLKWGSAVLFVLLVGTLGISSYKFGRVIGTPRANATEAEPGIERTATDAMKSGGALDADIGTLQANRGWANILSLGFGASQPVRDLATIRAGIFEQVLLREALAEVSRSLRTKTLIDPRGGVEARNDAQRFMAALEQYVAWYGCLGEDSPPAHMSLDNFQTLCGVVNDKEASMVANRERFFSEAGAYFNTIREAEGWGNPARLLSGGGMDAAATIRAALLTVHKYLAGYAKLNSDHPDPVVSEWMRVHAQCVTIESSYGRMLSAASKEPGTLEELEAFKEGFVADYATFAGAVEACIWRGPARGVHTAIAPLRPAILAQRELWTGYGERLKKAYVACESPPDQAVGRAIASLCAGSDEAGLPGLDRELWTQLRAAQLTEREYNEAYFEGQAFNEVVQEVPDRYNHVIALELGGGTASDRLVSTQGVGVVAGVLKQIHDRLLAAKLGPAEDAGTPSQWADQLERYLDPEKPAAPPDLGPLATVWRPDELKELYAAHLDLIALGEGRRLLSTIHEQLGQVGPWGFAELVPDWNAKVQSVYQIPIPREAEERSVGRREASKEEQPAKRERRDRRGRRGTGERRREQTQVPTVTIDKDRLIPQCATRGFLNGRAEECGNLLYSLRDFNTDFYFVSADDDRPLNEQCIKQLTRVGQAYFETYVESWLSAYQGKQLRELSRLVERADSWGSLAEMMGGSSRGRRPGRDERGAGSGDREAGSEGRGARGDRRGGSGDGRGASGDEVADELQSGLAEILEALPFWAWYFNEDTGEWTNAIDPEDREWMEVASWMQEAIEGRWPASLGRFAVDARLPGDNVERRKLSDPPWTVLANEFVQRWQALAKGIAAQAVLPTEFGSDTPPRKETPIPWNTIESLRQDARLEGEQLTGQLVGFEKQAQTLLSTALTESVCAVQTRHFRNLEPYDGWPYLNEAGREEKALDVADFAAFKLFVREIERAWKEFEPLERELPKDDPLWGARDRFYRGCRDWAVFMKLNDQLKPDDLLVEINGDDPVTEPFGKERVHDTAQYTYDAVELDLTLAVREGDEPGGDIDRPLRIPTLTEAKTGARKAVWRWSARPGNAPLTVSLVEGRRSESATQNYPALTHTLGESSPLALCAYLHRYGVPYGSKTVTSHAFDLVREFKAKGMGNLCGTLDQQKTVVGEKYIFTLDRPLPPPIARLERPAKR